MDVCPVCTGQGRFLGILGRFAWYRCRSCFYEFTTRESEGTDD